MALKDRIKDARLSRNYTQEQLANLTDVSPSAVSGYENGHKKPDIKTLVKIATELDVTLDYLCQDEITAVRNEPMQLNNKEFELIKKYRCLDEVDKETVKRILNV